MSHRRPPGAVLLLTALVAVLAFTLAVAPASAAPAGGGRAAKPSDAAIARQGLLRLSDFTSTGWTQSKHKASKPSGISACKGTEQVQARNKKYSVQSPDFANGDVTSAQNSVSVFPKPAQAVAYLKPYQAPAARTCLQQGAEKALKKVSGATVETQELDLSSALQGGTVDDAVGFEIVATVPTSGSTPVQIVFVVVGVRIGRAVAGFRFEDQGQPLSEIDSLISASLTRLATALG
jgi:hypothetical protein